MGSNGNQSQTYGREVESYRLDTTTSEQTITFDSQVFSFVIYAKTAGIRYEINGTTDDDSMELPAGEREVRTVLTSTIVVKTLAGAGEVYVSGHR